MHRQNGHSGVSLRAKATGWLAAILLVTLISIGIATGTGQWTVTLFDTLMEDNAACYAAQDAIKAETRAFERYVREPSQETEQAYTAACAETEQSLAALPFAYCTTSARVCGLAAILFSILFRLD